MAGDVDQFLSWFVTSPILAGLAEYNQPGRVIQEGSNLGQVRLPGDGRNQLDDDPDVRSILTGLWNNVGPLGPDGLWVIMLPPGVQVMYQGYATCEDICGYHQALSGTAYAVVPFPCNLCRTSAAPPLTIIECLTCTLSHEICEAVTNPFSDGLYSDTAGNPEICDSCSDGEWKTKIVGNYRVQQTWSNNAGTCV